MDPTVEVQCGITVFREEGTPVWVSASGRTVILGGTLFYRGTPVGWKENGRVRIDVSRIPELAPLYRDLSM